MALQPSIILSGRSPDIVGNVARGAQAAGLQNDVMRQNRLADLYAQEGPGILAGADNSLNALARLDPTQALGIRNTQSQMSERDERLRMARAAAARAAASASDKRAFAEQTRQEMAQLRQLTLLRDTDPQAFAQGLQTLGYAQDGATPENWDEYLALGNEVQRGVFSVLQDLQPEPVEPLSPAGKLAADLRSGQITQEQYDRATQRSPLVDFSNANIGGTGGSTPLPGGITPVAENIPAGADEAFGLEGFLKGATNTVTDFLGMGEAFPNAAEQQRFFRNLEEDMLVGLSQAYGRQPAQQLMEHLRDILPNTGTLEGANRALGELTTMEQRFRSDLASVNAQLAGNPRMNQSDRQELRAQQIGLTNTLNRMEEAKQRFRVDQPTGLSAEVEERLKNY